jgi:predicted nucleic acid-binding protein
VIPPDQALLFFDTNVLIQIARDNDLGRRIQERLGLDRRRERPLVSIVTVGEALALARQFGWGGDKTSSLRGLFGQLIVVDINQHGVVDRYAEITAHARKAGRALSDNDRWMAATASVTTAWLVTTDKDFDFLDPSFLKRTWFDPRGSE